MKTPWLISLLLFAPAIARGADAWPQFRGPSGQGHAVSATPPLEWSENKNVRWKTAIPGLGWSSPVVLGGQIWITTALDNEGSLRAICVDQASGKIVHDVEVFRKQDLGRIASKNSHASPTPVLDGRHVYVHFGGHGTACLDTKGEVVWRKELAYDHRHGPGGSPVLWNDLLIVTCDGPDEQYAVALDKQTGEVRWKTEHQGQQAYSTPLVIKANGQDQLITSRGEAVVALSPADGRELWRCRHEGHSVVPRPVAAGGFLYCCTGYWNPTLLAIRPDGEGDVSDSHVEFSVRRGVPHNPSPLVVNGQLYLVSDLGVLTCLDSGTGKEVWRERLSGNFSASPTLAEGRIYLVAENGATHVIEPGDKYKLLATNQLDGQALASPAFLGSTVFFRTDTHLYRLEEPRAAVAETPKAKSPQNVSRKKSSTFLK